MTKVNQIRNKTEAPLDLGFIIPAGETVDIDTEKTQTIRRNWQKFVEANRAGKLEVIGE